MCDVGEFGFGEIGVYYDCIGCECVCDLFEVVVCDCWIVVGIGYE